MICFCPFGLFISIEEHAEIASYFDDSIKFYFMSVYAVHSLLLPVCKVNRFNANTMNIHRLCIVNSKDDAHIDVPSKWILDGSSYVGCLFWKLRPLFSKGPLLFALGTAHSPIPFHGHSSALFSPPIISIQINTLVRLTIVWAFVPTILGYTISTTMIL